MKILRNPPSFHDLINSQNLELPKTLSEARKVVRNGSCRPTSYWDFEFTDLDEEKLGKHLSSIFDGAIKRTFIFNFAMRFLSIARKNMEETR